MSGLEFDWYSEQLAAAEEPSLYHASQRPRPADAQTIRFTWLRSFHSPVVIRVEGAKSQGYRLIAKELSGAGGYKPGHIARTVTRRLTADEAVRLNQVLDLNRVFSLPLKDCMMGCDGASWIIEGVDGEGYHFLERWTPQKGPVYGVGMFLLSLSGWKFEEVY